MSDMQSYEHESRWYTYFELNYIRLKVKFLFPFLTVMFSSEILELVLNTAVDSMLWQVDNAVSHSF
jgi:hypothetical protein